MSNYTQLESSLLLDNCNENNAETEEVKKKGSYNEVFDSAGFGKWQILLLFQCGWANASDAIEIMCISFIMTSMGQSFNVSNEKLTGLTVSLFLGMMVGGYVWGSLADHYGRRRIVMQSLLVNSIFSFLSAFAPNLSLLVLLRFLSGIGAGGSLPVCFSYFSEFQPNNRRGAMISMLAAFWMAGNIVAAGLAWLVLPQPQTWVVAISPHGEPWRLFIVLCSIPSFTSALLFLLLPESPLFLYKSGRTAHAFQVLRTVHRWNHHRSARMPYSGIFDDADAKSCDKPHVSITVASMARSMRDSVAEQWRVMFSTRQGRRRRSLALCGVSFAIAFSYGLSMWLPTLISRIENQSGSPCDATPLATANISVQQDQKAGNSTTSADTYVDVFIGTAAQLPANLVAIAIIDRVGGKPMLVAGFLTSSITSFLFSTSKTKTQVIVVNALFNSATTFVWDALDVVLPELYETRVRASANGFLTAWSRIAALLGNAVMGAFIDTSCYISLLTFALVFIVGAISSFFLPNTRGVDLN